MNPVEIPLSRGFVALISPEDVARASEHNWHLSKSRVVGGVDVYYARAWVGGGPGKGVHTLLHRFIMSALPSEEVDHRDNNKLHCTRENLRVISHADNIRNSVCRSSTGFKGVYEIRGRFLASATVARGKKETLGWFDRPEQAALAFDAFVRKRFGDLARYNFPRGLELPARVQQQM